MDGRGFNTVILAGGSTINGLFLKENLINEIWLTVEPRVFGEGLSLFKGADVDLKLEFIEYIQMDTNVLQIRYRIK